MESREDTSIKGFCEVYHMAIESINNKRYRQDDAIEYLQKEKSSLKNQFDAKMRDAARATQSSDFEYVAIKVMRLNLLDSENPYIKLWYPDEEIGEEIGKAYNDEQNIVGFLRDKIFAVE